MMRKATMLRVWCGTLMVTFTNLVVAVHGTTIKDSALFDAMFTGYQREVFPRCGNDSSARSVTIGIALRQIIDLDEPTQIMKAYLWVRLSEMCCKSGTEDGLRPVNKRGVFMWSVMQRVRITSLHISWSDCRLTWNETENGIGFIVVPYNTVWTPDVTLYENAEGTLTGLTAYRPIVYPDGTVAYNFPSIVNILCKVDVTYFPFDKQVCSMTFGSWAYDGLAIDIVERKNAGDTSSYISNGEWDLEGFPSERHESYYGCCPEPYPDVTFYIQLIRRPRFYTLNLIFPCVLMAAMSLLGFILPPDSGEKVSLEITVLLSLSVFMLMVSEIMPPTSETFPYIGVYFAVVMLLVSMSCLVTVAILVVHHRGGHGRRLPLWLKRAFLRGLGPWLLVHTRAEEESGCFSCNKVRHQEAETVENLPSIPVPGDNIGNLPDGNKEKKDSFKTKLQNEQLCVVDLTKPVPETEELKVMREQLECINSIKTHLESKSRLDEIKDEWQTLARVLDRLFIVIFLLEQVLATLVIMLQISSGN